MTLPAALEPLRRDGALSRLVVPMRGGASPEEVARVAEMALPPALEAVAWLYVDELERAHAICQAMDDPLGAAIHAVVHRREGDFGNALYWYHRAGAPDGEGAKLTKAVAAGDRSDVSVARQRAEWEALAARAAA